MEYYAPEGSSRSVLSRKSLFPCEKVDSDDSDVGYMSPLNSSTTNSSDSEDPHSGTTEPTQNKLDDYIIYDDKYSRDTNCPVIQAKSTPKTCRVPCASESMSPLMLSPLQSLVSSPIVYSPNTDGIVPLSSTLDLSPSAKMKTPHDTSVVLTKAPKLVRKSLIDNSEHDLNEALSDSLSDSTLNKSGRLDSSLNKSKVRTALFPEDDLSLTVQQFYPKCNKCERLVCEAIVVDKKPKQKLAPTFICNRKRTVGQINAGVRHKIKKPKNKNKKQAYDKLMKAAAKVIKNSPLNEYFNKENTIKSTGNKITEHVSKYVQAFNERNIQPLKEQTKMTHLNNRREEEHFVMLEEKGLRKRTLDTGLFNVANPRGVITVNKCIKIGVDDGQFELLDEPALKRHKHELSFDAETDTFDSITSANVPAILNTLYAHETNTNLTVVEQANILLSPTSQMCDMTSGLAINSPKRAKLNITHILNPPTPNCTPTTTHVKLFPVFDQHAKSTDHKTKTATKHHTNTNTTKPKPLRALSPSQMFLDAGQKRFGITQCADCQFVYHMGDPSEELMHNNHHSAANVLRFNGWKHEHVVAENVDSRVIRVTVHDSKLWWRRVREIVDVVNRDLGLFDVNVDLDRAVVYLYIRQRSVGGCLVAEPKQVAHRFLPALQLGGAQSSVDLCSEETFPVRCGVVRVWTSPRQRRNGVATALMDTLRTNFSYGEILRLEDIAFSCPTDDGKQFAYSYFGTQNLLIYS